jgi:hypothetical protein
MNLHDLNQKKNVDLRTVQTGTLYKLDRQLRRLIDTAFSGPGVVLFLAGVVFAIGVLPKH